MGPEGRERDESDPVGTVGDGLREWRAAHPRASWSEIEGELDARWYPVRARLLEEAALSSTAANLAAQVPSARPCCPSCGTMLVDRGQHERLVTVHGNQAIRLRRSYGVCPACGAGLFPPR